MLSRAIHIPKTAFYLLLVLPVLTSIGFAQIVPGEGLDSGLGGENILVGTVYVASGQRLTRSIQVKVGTAMSGDRTVMTDEKGNFVLKGLPSGNYTVSIDKEKDFEPFTQALDVIQFRGSPAQTYTLNIRLNPKSSTEPKPGVNAEFAGVPKSALVHYAKGIELAKTASLAGAIEEFKLALSEHPAFLLAFNEMGVQHMRLNENDKADAAFQEALKINPDAFAPMMNRGITLVNLKRYADAEQVLRKVLRADENSAVGHYFLGTALANQGKFDEAEKELSIAVKTGGPEMKEAHRILAIIYSSKGDKKRAADELETYLKLAPLAPDAETLRQLIRQFREATE